jgi:hypothetical protein
MKYIIPVLVILAVALFVVGCTAPKSATVAPVAKNEPVEIAPEPVIQPESYVEPAKSVEPALRYSGKVLAGNITPYLEFNKADYDKAVADGKLIFLYFYGEQDPTSGAEDVLIKDAFNEMDYTTVVGFRVNYQDSSTDNNEAALAENLGITSLHVKVIMKNGRAVDKDSRRWLKPTIINSIGSQLN